LLLCNLGDVNEVNSSPNIDDTPTFLVTDVEEGNTVNIYSGDNCNGDFSGSGIVEPGQNSVEVTISSISDQSNLSYSATVTDDLGNLSNCSNDLINYELVDSSAFISVWSTSSDGETITIPTAGEGYHYTIRWGDDTPEENISVNTSPSHTYAVAGDYTIIISIAGLNNGAFPRVYFNNAGDKEKIKSIPSLGAVGWTSFENAFYGCSYLGTVFGGDTSNVTSMQNMFNGATSASPGTSGSNTINVTTMQNMFYGALAANPDTSGWNTLNVTNMREMFYRASSATPNTTNWDVSSAQNFYMMFRDAVSANPDVKSWNTANVTVMHSMFRGAKSASPDTSGEHWVTNKVFSMREMFAQTTYANPDVANWDTSKVRDMREMFWAAAAAKPDTSKWNTSQVRSMRGMFNGAGNANPVTSSWDMSSIVDPEYIFTNSGISQENYDLFLIMSEATSSNSGIKVNSPAQYSTGDAADARQSLIDDHGWEFSDKGCLDCSP